jgi:hypothetical protein
VKNTVQVAKVVGVTVTDEDRRGYVDFEVEVKTEGGIKMTLSIPHNEADWLRVLIIGEIESMPDTVRRHSFVNSIRRYVGKVKAAA